MARLTRLGLADRRNDELEKLSRGNPQRVQLAAALLFGQEALILDEPFVGLDPLAVDVMSAVLREQADAGIQVVFSSHQLELVERLCDRVGIIRSGEMGACGPVNQLRQTGGERLWVDAPQAPDGWWASLPGVRPCARRAPGHCSSSTAGLTTGSFCDRVGLLHAACRSDTA